MSYRELKDRLNQTIGQLEAENLDVDEAIKLYEKAQKTIIELEKYLEKSKNHIESLNKNR